MSRSGRIAVRLLAGGVLLTTGIYFLAMWDMARERRARRYLGDRLYAEVRGRGDPVVFLAGLQGSTRFWNHDLDALAASHRLIFVDELGFARSPWPKRSAYTLDDHLNALRRTLLALGATGKVTIVAHSFGTVLAAAYAARYPGEVQRLVLLGTPVWSSPSEGRARIRAMSALGAVFTFNRPLALAACTTMCALRPLLQFVLPKLVRDRPPEVVSDSVLHELGAVEGGVRILLSRPIAPYILQLGPRVTFLHGRTDAVTPLGEVEHLARQAGARLVVVDSDHSHYLTSARQTIAAEISRAGNEE